MARLKKIAVWAAVGFFLAAAPGRAVDITALPPLPRAVEKKAFLDFLLKTWAFDRDRPGPACAPLLETLRKGTGVAFLEPDAAGELERPQAILDIDRTCTLDIGTNLMQEAGSPARPAPTREEVIDAYGPPQKATQNFTLYHVRVKDAPLAIHFAERLCDGKGDCRSAPAYDLIDLAHCRKEMVKVPARYGAADSSTTGSVTGVVRIKDEMFILWAGVTGDFATMMRDQWPEPPSISLSRLPQEVEPGRYGNGAECLFVSPQTPVRDPRIRPPR
jgi:hypothetical protein